MTTAWPELRAEVGFDGSEAVVSVQGELDLVSAPTVGALLRALVDEGYRPIVLDLSRLAFMDASGLAVIVEVSARLARSSGELVIRSAPALVERILALTGVADLVIMETDLDPDAVVPEPKPAAPFARTPGVDRSELTVDLADDRERRAQQQVLDAALGMVTTLTRATVDGADGVSVTLRREGRMTTVASTGTTIRRMDAHQYETGQGPCLSAAAEGRAFHASPLADEERWPAFVPRAIEEGIGTILATPLVVAGRSLGSLNVYSESPRPFGAVPQHLAALFADQASGLLAEADAASAATDDQLASRIRSALLARETIARAQGVYMARQGISPALAARTLHRAARAADTSVVALAGELVGSTHPTDRPPGQRPEHV